MPRAIQPTTGVLWGNSTTTVPTYIATITQLDLNLPDEAVAKPPLKPPVWALILIALAGVACLLAIGGIVWAASRRAKARRAREYDSPSVLLL